MLENLIEIKDGKVSARELHKVLGVGRDFTTWIKGRIEKYGFVELRDFTVINLTPQNGGARWGGNNKVDYVISLGMAKELCMIENSELGRKFREYFIECEEYIKRTQEEQFNQWRESSEEEKAILERRLIHAIEQISQICGDWKLPRTIEFADGELIPQQFIEDTMFRLWINKDGSIKRGAANKVAKGLDGRWFISDIAIKCLKVNWIKNKETLKEKYSTEAKVF